jgi:outer membrane protein OmpA-like peptidoglycan-associated protein
MKLSRLSDWNRLAASSALSLVMAMPVNAAPVARALSSPAGTLVITVQAKEKDTEAGADALRRKLREKRQEGKGNTQGNGGGPKNDAASEAAPAQSEDVPTQTEQAPAAAEQPAVAQPAAREEAPAPQPETAVPGMNQPKKKRHENVDQAKGGPAASQQTEQPAQQPENAAPAIQAEPAPQPQNEAGNTGKGGGRKQRDAQQTKDGAETPKPKRITVPKTEEPAPAEQRTGTEPVAAPETVAPQLGRSKKPQQAQPTGKNNATEPEMPAPKTVTVPKQQDTAPAQAETANPPAATESGKSGGTAADKLRRDLREKLRRQTQGRPETPSAESTSQGELAPLTDSGKEATGAEVPAPLKPGRQKPGTRQAKGSGQAQPAPEQVITPQTLPKTDADAQVPAITGQKLESIQAESGSAVQPDRRPRRQFDDSKVVGRFGDRIVIRLDNGRLSIFSTDDHDRRLRRNSSNVRVEELRGGRLRETIFLRDGSRIVTIYNRYGDILRRSRILPDGREVLLVYVPRDRWNDLRDPYYDPGRFLPPLVLTIPRSDYIFERERASADDYYRFLRQPPVEPVPRLYSVDEVTRSARIRDMARRVDLVSVHFEFGSADISESEVDELQTLAEAMNRLLDENPGEMFLIEGHTDAVGSEEANLVLSDKRAESVAEVLTDYFGIPPENMVTHGYGERYLKINTQAPERENRRVAIRRITPLVAPVNEQVLR